MALAETGNRSLLRQSLVGLLQVRLELVDRDRDGQLDPSGGELLSIRLRQCDLSMSMSVVDANDLGHT